MSNNKPIADAAARARALTPDQSFIVQAPAGSGKTELLTQRYLRLLSCVDHPEEIVAITFTRKAANEMRNRVLEALEKAKGSRPETPNEAATWELAKAALARDETEGWNVIASPERLRVSTIDSFCAALTRQMPMLSRLGAPPAVMEDAEVLYREAARELIARLESDEKVSPAIVRLLQHLDNDLPRVEGLIAGMLARRDQWMRHVGSGERPSREHIEAALARVIEDALADLRSAMPTVEVPELLALARFAAENLRATGTPSEILACLDMTELPGTTTDDLAKWRGLGSLLITAKGEWRKTVTTKNGFPAPSEAPNASEKARLKSAKDRFKVLIEKLSACPGLVEHLAGLFDLPPPRYDDSQWEVVEALYQLLLEAVKELWVVFQNRGEVDFTQVSWSALRALGTHDEPTDLALTLDYRIQHVLIDEFQDTSLSQYELLDLLTAGWTPGDGRSLFVVGDPMQSIYRFRQAEVGLFLRAWHQGIGNVRLEPLKLKVNFRSQGGIVEWVNRAFARAFPAQEDVAAGAVTYSPAQAYDLARAEPAVMLHPMLGRDDEKEAERAVDLVKQAMADPSQKTIAILVRSKGHLREIAPRLRRAGLRFRAVEIEALGHRSVVQDLLALTRALVHPGDRLSWLAALRAPWCGLTLADLETLAGDDQKAALWELMQDTGRLARLSADGRTRLDRVRVVIADCNAHRRRRPLRRLVEGTWLALGGPACAADATDLADALAYLDLLEELEVAGDLVELNVLAERVEDLFALPDVEATERLQLMTIHKAKGLQFHTVIVPGLGRIPRHSESPLLVWAERPNPRARAVDLLLAPIRESGKDAEPIFSFLRQFDDTKSRYEDGRVLYVAATRAIDRLHLLGHVAVSEKNGAREVTLPPRSSLLYHLWEEVRPEFDKALNEMSADERGNAVADVLADPPRALLRRLPISWLLPAIPAPVAWNEGEAVIEAREALPRVEFEWAREVIRHVGTLVHWVLQHIGRDGLENWDRERIGKLRPVLARRLAEEGVPPAQLEAAVARAETALTRTLSDERGRWILDQVHSDAHGEYALSGIIDGEIVNAILDRTFVDDKGVRWIIDYKASSHEGGGLDEFLDRECERYAAQLERYATLMGKIDARPIRLGLYFPLLGGWREWAPAATNR
ncbi:MAG: UvrD-helicase domain-containing protein [Sulfuricaulis sp.]|nr:UvrD-helicase domain-containing protein [Sulfuricaulis sp.]